MSMLPLRRMLGISVLALGTTPLHAHHSFASYDFSKTLTLEGTVRQFLWQNPHSHIMITVAPGSVGAGAVTEWDIEGPAPNIMVRQGWNKLTLKPGDRVTLFAHPMRESPKDGALMYAVVNGKTMYADAGRPVAAPAAAEKQSAK